MSFTLTEPRLDRIQSTVAADFYDVVKGLEKTLDCEARATPRGQFGYQAGYELRAGDRTLARVFGDREARQFPHVMATGSDAPVVDSALRLLDHVTTYSRVDVAVDTDHPGAYDRLTTAALAKAERYGVTKMAMGDPTRAEGHTLYVGASSSETRLRIYDKAAESPGEYAPGTVRAELQVRPKGPARKALAADMAPTDLLGFARWSREFFAEEFDFTGAVPPPRAARKGDLDAWLSWLAATQRNRLLETFDRAGGDLEDFALAILRGIPDMPEGWLPD